MSPSYIDIGMVKDDQRVETLTLKNIGYGDLVNAVVKAPSTPWMAIVSGGDMTGISAGAEQSLAVMFRPGADIMPGVYNDSITIYADNHLPFTYYIQATVTSNRTGSVLFDVLNEFYEDVAGARIPGLINLPLYILITPRKQSNEYA